MKYAVTYYNKFKYLDVIDEIILYWSTKDNVADYVKEKYSQNQRIIVSIDRYDNDLETFFDDILLPALIELKKEHNNMSLRIDHYNEPFDKGQLEKLKKGNIRYYFDQPCNSWDILYGLVSLGASDVIITEELCFDLKAVSAFCKARGVKIRVYPNVAQYNGYGLAEQIPDIKKFFIRPEDTEIYEKYVDVFELYGTFEQRNVVYEIYKQQQWLGDLNDIIYGFSDEVPNTGILEHFAAVRINCRKNCLRDGKCNICNRMKELAIMMAESDLALTSERKPIRENDTEIEKIMSIRRESINENAEEISEE